MKRSSLAFHDIAPQAKIHVLVIPKSGAYVSWDDFSANATGEEQADYVAAIGATARKLGIDTSGYRILANHGRDSHQEVPHLHVHILAGQPLGPMLEGGASAAQRQLFSAKITSGEAKTLRCTPPDHAFRH